MSKTSRTYYRYLLRTWIAGHINQGSIPYIGKDEAEQAYQRAIETRQPGQVVVLEDRHTGATLKETR